MLGLLTIGVGVLARLTLTGMAVGSVLMMGLALNIAAALILALSICFYVFVYTVWLKRRTPE